MASSSEAHSSASWHYLTTEREGEGGRKEGRERWFNCSICDLIGIFLECTKDLVLQVRLEQSPDWGYSKLGLLGHLTFLIIFLIFLIIFILVHVILFSFPLRFSVLVVVYMVGGMIFMKYGRGAEGREVIPNYNVWIQMPSLVKVCGNSIKIKNVKLLQFRPQVLQCKLTLQIEWCLKQLS